MLISKQILLGVIGFSCGISVAAGTFAFITMIGIIPRLADRTKTAQHLFFYERMVIWGGTLGNLWGLYEYKLPLTPLFLCLYGLGSGVFVGCLAMALAEMLKALPIMVNRIQLKEGFPILITAIAIGKFAGTIFQYFF